jgi:hypothetical protein
VVIGSLATAVISDRAFFIVSVPLEFLPRLFGKPPVKLAIQKESATYWQTRCEQPVRSDYKRQF